MFRLILMMVGLRAIYQSALPQYLIAKYIKKMNVAFPAEKLWTCTACYGFWLGAVLGVMLQENPLTLGILSSGVLTTWDQLKNTIYAWFWAQRLNTTSQGRLILDAQTMQKATGITTTTLPGAASSEILRGGVENTTDNEIELVRDYSNLESYLQERMERAPGGSCSKQKRGNT